MSIRISALYICVAILVAYAWKDWFKSLCGLILLIAFIRHEDMPTTMFGIQGLNMWNVLFLGIFLAWVANRRHEGLTWDMPRHINVLLLMYLGVILVSFLRAVFDRSYIEDYPLKSMISEELINTIKWVLPGLLLFVGCRTRKRVIMVLICILVMYFLVSAQVINRMPFESALGGSNSEIQHIRLKTCSSIGYSACDTSAMLAGASWGILAMLPLVRQKKYKVLVLAAAGIVTFGQALTGGRSGYLAWGATGLLLCLIKWRKYLILIPVVVILLPIVFPGTAERMLTGFRQIDVAGQTTNDALAITSDRMSMWPYVINKIVDCPLIGYGQLAMSRIGLEDQMFQMGLHFSHPHNMYLETLLDNGILGSIPILLFWGILVIYSAILFRSDNHLCSAVGGVTLALMLGQLFSGVGSQHIYPKISTMGMWTGIFLVLRVHVEKEKEEFVSTDFAYPLTAHTSIYGLSPITLRRNN